MDSAARPILAYAGPTAGEADVWWRRAKWAAVAWAAASAAFLTANHLQLELLFPLATAYRVTAGLAAAASAGAVAVLLIGWRRPGPIPRVAAAAFAVAVVVVAVQAVWWNVVHLFLHDLDPTPLRVLTGLWTSGYSVIAAVPLLIAAWQPRRMGRRLLLWGAVAAAAWLPANFIQLAVDLLQREGVDYLLRSMKAETWWPNHAMNAALLAFAVALLPMARWHAWAVRSVTAAALVVVAAAVAWQMSIYGFDWNDPADLRSLISGPASYAVLLAPLIPALLMPRRRP